VVLAAPAATGVVIVLVGGVGLQQQQVLSLAVLAGYGSSSRPHPCDSSSSWCCRRLQQLVAAAAAVVVIDFVVGVGAAVVFVASKSQNPPKTPIWCFSLQPLSFLSLSGVGMAPISHRRVVVGRGMCVGGVEDGGS